MAKYRLKERREEVGYTQTQLSKVSGVNRYTISLLEKNCLNSVRKKTLDKLADALGCSVNVLFN